MVGECYRTLAVEEVAAGNSAVHEHLYSLETSERSDDHGRREVLISCIPSLTYRAALDIGCGDGFITQKLPAPHIIGVDIDQIAVERARTVDDRRLSFRQGALADIHGLVSPEPPIDLVVMTGLLYEKNIGSAHGLVYTLIDSILQPGGILVTGHFAELYSCRFPYLLAKELTFSYCGEPYLIEVYAK